jgi:dolichyl-phosphate beta-glucosyltransferase
MIQNNIFISIVIPCYNEERNIRLGALESVSHYLGKQQYTYEVILVDDGSSDQSRHLIKNFISDHSNFRLLPRIHQGKAATVMAGMQESKGKIVLFTDLDQATPINQIEKILPYFKKGYDIVIGSRSGKRRGAPLFRRLMALGFMFLRNLILNLGIEDTQCGFKAFKKDTSDAIFSRVKVHNLTHSASGSTVTAGFDVEVLYIAKILGYKIREVPIEWHYQETRHVSPIKDPIDGLIDLVKIRLNSIRGVYNQE